MPPAHSFDDDKLKEECGVFGVIGTKDAANFVALGLHALQHRGQEAGGIVSYDEEHGFNSARRFGYVRDNFTSQKIMETLPGPLSIGHVRYSTSGNKGQTAIRDVQPFFGEFAQGGAAIAHNGNISNGMMFPSMTVDGQPIDADYASLRARWEPIYEVTQVKGDGEAHPTLSPNDEFADFENWDADNIGRTEAKEDWMLQHEYARSALKLGLANEAELGINPFKFGLIGSTDGHNTISTTEEDNFFGKFPESEPKPERMTNAMANDALWKNWRLVASGYAAVWAKENTRAALFDAMKRREVYATTGSRIQVRFFGGWSFDASDIHKPDYVARGYQKGVPMGGDLTQGPESTAPTFLIAAAKDPDGANLDRVQVIKGWQDASGALQEQVYDVAWSAERMIDAKTGKLEAVGSTVDIETATYLNTIGATDLATYWQDPNFDASERAFYYVRVLEIPRPRWTTVDAAYFGVDLPDEAPRSIQDRAYTSPIWYTP